MVNTISVQDTTLVSEALSVRVQCLCLVKRSRALLESIPTRDNQARAGECSRAGLGRVMATEALLFPIIHLPCHASQNSPPPRRKNLALLREFLGHSGRAGDGGFRAFVVAQGQQPPSIRVGVSPSPIPYALCALSGSRERKRPIFATASRTLARAHARHASPSRHGPFEDSADGFPFSLRCALVPRSCPFRRYACSEGVLS